MGDSGLTATNVTASKDDSESPAGRTEKEKEEDVGAVQMQCSRCNWGERLGKLQPEVFRAPAGPLLGHSQ